MNNQITEALKELIKAVDQRNFNLEVWKLKAGIVIKEVFGNDDVKLKMINQLNYDYSSWSLRDQSGSGQLGAVKDEAKGILEAALLELSLSSSIPNIIDELKGFITQEEFEQLQNIWMKSDVQLIDIQQQLAKLPADVKDKLISSLIIKSKR